MYAIQVGNKKFLEMDVFGQFAPYYIITLHNYYIRMYSRDGMYYLGNTGRYFFVFNDTISEWCFATY